MLTNLPKTKLLLFLFLFTSCIGPSIEKPNHRNMRRSLESYGKVVATNNNMKLLFFGNPTQECQGEYGLSFISRKTMMLEEGKALVTPIVCNFVEEIKQNGYVQEYVKSYHDTSPTQAKVVIKIAFWDEEVNRPKPPYLAAIVFGNNTFHYYQADPETQSLQLVYQESYEEAIANERDPHPIVST